MVQFQYEALLNTSFLVEGKERNVSELNVNAKRKKNVSSLNTLPKMITPIAIFQHIANTHHELSPTCKSNLQRKSLVNDQAPCSALIAMSDVEPVKRKILDNDQAPCRAEIPICDVEAVKNKRLVDAQAPFRAKNPISNVEASLDFLSAKKEGFLKASIMVEGKERNVSVSNVMGLNGGAGYDMFPNFVRIRRRGGSSFKIINVDNSEELQRLTGIDVLSMQFDSCEAGEYFYRKYASAIGFVVGEEYTRRNDHGKVVQKRWVCNSEEGFQQNKHLLNEFNCFAAFCIHLVSHKWFVREFVAEHTHHELSPTCKSHLQIDSPQKNLVNVKRERVVNDQAPCSDLIAMSDVEPAKRKKLDNDQAPCRAEIPICDVEAVKRKRLVDAQAPLRAENPISNVEASLDFLRAKKEGFLKASIMVEGKERNVSVSNVMGLNGGAGYDNMFPNFVRIRRRGGSSFKIINVDNSEELQRLTGIDVLSMQFDSCEAGEYFYRKYASAIGFVVGEEYTRRNDHGKVVQKRWVCNSEEGFQQNKHLLNEFNCFAAFCIHLVSHKWFVREFVAEHTHHELSPTCKSHLQIDSPQKNLVNVKRKIVVNDQAPCSALIAMSDVEPAKREKLDHDEAPCRAEIPICDVEAAKRKRLVDAQAPFRAENPISNVEASLDFLSAKKEDILKASIMVEGKEGDISGSNVMGHKWLVRDFVATHTHYGLSPTCSSHLQIDPSQNNLVNANRKNLLVSLRIILKLITPITAFKYQGFLKTSIMIERKETNGSGSNVMSRNGGAGCRSFFIRDNDEDYHNMFPNLVQNKRRNVSFKIINADNSRELQRLTEIDVLPMQFAEEGFQQKKHLEGGFNCFAAICRHLVSHKWSVKEFVAAHTHHELSPTCKSRLEIDCPQKNLVNVKRKRVVNDQAPCSALIAMSDVESAKRKRLVNAQAPCRSEIPINDVEAALDFLSAKKHSDNGLFYETQFVEGHLTSLFWADSISQLDNACFGEVMAVYRTKLCMMHFVVLTGLNHYHRTCVFGCALLQDETVEAYTWLFQTFLHVMQGCMPLSVVTDDHQAIREAIKLVLPRSRHRLCTQHLEKIAHDNVNNPFFISDFKACMREVLSQDDFELKWKRMVEMYKLSENPWIQRMHGERHMWAETYLRGSFSAGLQSTKICESIDKHLRKSSQNKLKLHEFLNEFECAINALWREEGKAECKSALSQGALSNPLKKHAAEVFTWNSYKKFLSEMRLESCLFVVNKDECTDYRKYRLCNPENQNLVYEVMVKPSGPSIKCSCLKFETLGFPCCHAIHVLKSEGIDKIPQDLIHPRWTKSAKLSAQFWHRSLPPVSSDTMLKMMRYGNSAYLSSILCYWESKSDKVHNLFLGGDHELEHQIQDQLWCI